jgi:hypothetical protein
MVRPSGRCFQAAECRRMPAAAAKQRAASGRRGSDALPKIGCDSTRRAIATLGDNDSAVQTSWRSGRGLFRTRSYPQILLKTLILLPSSVPTIRSTTTFIGKSINRLASFTALLADA